MFVSLLRQGQTYSWNPYVVKAHLQLWTHTRIKGLHHHTSGLFGAGLHLDLPVNRGLLPAAQRYLSHIPGQDDSFKPNWILVDIWWPWSSWSFYIHFNITSFNSPSKDCQKSIPLESKWRLRETKSSGWGCCQEEEPYFKPKCLTVEPLIVSCRNWGRHKWLLSHETSWSQGRRGWGEVESSGGWSVVNTWLSGKTWSPGWKGVAGWVSISQKT